ncbi:hypothetical protein HUU53_00005, partial [Candidatus Micrarchaeota archaeon]|nr:hypothetical protein [Candidatus Micrarchaeota archaeon]
MKRSHGGYSKHSRNLTAGKKVTVAKRLLVLKSGDRVRIKVDPRHMAGRTQILRFNNRL